MIPQSKMGGSVESLLVGLGEELAAVVLSSRGELFDGPWDVWMSVDHYSPGHSVGTQAAFFEGERIVDRYVGIKMLDVARLSRLIDKFRWDFPVPFWLFDALIFVSDRRTGRGVVHVVCGGAAAEFEASLATSEAVKQRAFRFLEIPESSVTVSRPIVVADGVSAVLLVENYTSKNPVPGFVVEDAVVSRVEGGWRVFVRDRPGELRVDRTYFLVADDGRVIPVSSGMPPSDAVARYLGGNRKT